jgi:hypothetical protein
MKQTTRIKILTSIFLLTGLLAGYILFKDFGWTSTENSKIALTVDSSSLFKITTVYNNETTILTKGPANWVVNSKYNVRNNLIPLLFIGLTKSEVKRPVAAENKEKIIALLKQKGVRIKTEDAINVNSFTLASNDNDANSSYYMAEGSTEPYIIFVPGFTGDMANLFKMDEANWRSKILFNSTPLSLQQIKISYPSFPKSNISIKWNTNKTFTIDGIQFIDSSKVVTYLAQFEQVTVDQYLYKNKELIINS